MTDEPTPGHKRRLRTFSAGIAGGLLVGAAALLALDLADRAAGGGGPPLRRSVRHAVLGSTPHDDALALLRGSREVEAAVGVRLITDLVEWTVSDEASATRLRFVARVSGSRGEGALAVDALHDRRAWRLERVRFTPDAGAPIDLTPGAAR